MLNKNVIYNLALEFRESLEKVICKREYGKLSIFARFPIECCRYSSDLLATYLIYKGIPKKYIQLAESKTIEEEYTHCWLVIDGEIIVDITADQFNRKNYFKKYEPIPECCVVERGTYFYKLFDKNSTVYFSDVGIDTYNGDIPEKLRFLYLEILKNIPEKKGEEL